MAPEVGRIGVGVIGPGGLHEGEELRVVLGEHGSDLGAVVLGDAGDVGAELGVGAVTVVRPDAVK